jgi:hypothetical protein
MPREMHAFALISEMGDVVQIERYGWNNSAISFIVGSKSLLSPVQKNA